MKRKLLILSWLIVQLGTLGSCDLYGNKDLGNKLTLWARDSPEGHYDVVYCSRYDMGGCVSGIYVIPASVEEIDSMYVSAAKSDDKWVIAKTVQIEGNKESYWIIDKSFNIEDVDCWTINCDSILQSHVIGRLDDQEFAEKVRVLGINLRF